MRAVVASSREPNDAGVALPVSWWQIFFSSIGVAALVGLAASAAFFAACFVVGFGGMALTNSIEGGVIGGLVAGGIMGLIVAVWLFRLLWARRS